MKPPIYISVDYSHGVDQTIIAIRRGSPKSKKVQIVNPRDFVGGKLTAQEARGIVELLVLPERVQWN